MTIPAISGPRMTATLYIAVVRAAAAGSFSVPTMLGIIAGVLVMAWSFGPAIVLLFLRPRYRREKREWATRCRACGYDLRVQLAVPGSADRCPECGTLIAR